MGHKENKKSKHNGKSKETAQSDPSQPISDAVIDAVDRSQRNSDSSPEWHGDELERPSHNGERLKKKIYVLTNN